MQENNRIKLSGIEKISIATYFASIIFFEIAKDILYDTFINLKIFYCYLFLLLCPIVAGYLMELKIGVFFTRILIGIILSSGILFYLFLKVNSTYKNGNINTYTVMLNGETPEPSLFNIDYYYEIKLIDYDFKKKIHFSSYEYTILSEPEKLEISTQKGFFGFDVIIDKRIQYYYKPKNY
jgi:hypothetical protein